MSFNNLYRIPKDASYVTLRNQNRMLYANYVIQQNNVQQGCQIRVALENGGVADADIIPKLLEGARETTSEERDRAIASEACPVSAAAPPSTDGGSMLFTQSFAGGGTQVTYPNSASLLIGTSDFTIEWFQFWTDDGNFPRVFSVGSYPAADIAISYEGVTYFWINGSPTQIYNTVPPLNTWTHIAIVGSGGTTVRFYVNGTRQYNASLSYSFIDSSTTLAIGNETTRDAISAFNGRITNFRWVKGTALYSAATITVPTQPLTAISGTQLLLLASNAANVVKDSSSANRTPTNTGVSYSSTTPF